MKTTLNKKEFQAVADSIIRSARKNGADHAAVEIESKVDALARFSRNQIIQNIEKNLSSVIVALSVNEREIAVTLDNIPSSPQEIDTITREAVDIAAEFARNPEHVPPIQPQTYETVNCVDEETLHFSHEQKAQKIQQICKAVADRDLLSYGTFRTTESYNMIANSNGLFTDHPETNADFTLTVRTKDGTGSCREVRSNHSVNRLEIDDCVEKTIEWTEHSRNPREITPQDYTVVLSPTAALNYLMFAFWAFDARKVDENRSPLVHLFNENDPIGKQHFSPLIGVRSVAAHPEHPERQYTQALSMDGMMGQGLTTTMFSKGLPVKTFPLIEKGVVRSLFHSYYWARHKNKEPFGFPTLLEFDGSDKSLDDLVAGTENGLLINSFWYIRFVDNTTLLLTGLTRDGAFKIEDGKIAYPVKNLRFNESPLLSMANVSEIGRPERQKSWGNTVLIPPMKIENFTFSSDTDAI